MSIKIACHEGFGLDGKSIWLDLQLPCGERFYFAGADVRTRREIAAYGPSADAWSIEYAIPPRATMFAGVGGDPTQVAHARDGMLIYVFHSEGKRFRSEKLVDMRVQGWRAIESNMHSTPDGKWVVVGASFEGRNEIYAAQIAKAAELER